MKCPNCGRLDFDSSEICPRCGEPLPPGSGEISSGSRESMPVSAPPEKKPPDSPGPLFTPSPPTPTETEDETPAKVKSEKAVADEEPPSMPPTPQHEMSVDDVPPERPEPPMKEVQKDIEEIYKAKPEKSPKPEPHPEEEKWPEREQPPVSAPAAPPPLPSSGAGYAPEDYVKKPEPRTPPPSQRPAFKEGGKTAIPEDYQRDSATFSSELSTDWIEKYARSHVIQTSNIAGLGMRIWAFIIDWLLIAAMGVVILLAGRLVIVLLDGQSHTPMEYLRLLALPVGGLWLALIMLYFTVFSTASGQTPGKLAMDLRVTGLNGYPPSFSKSFLRVFIYLLGMIPFGAGLWWALTNEERRAWHDRAAGTVVQSVIHKK